MRILIVLLAVFCLAGALPAADLGCGCVPPLKAPPVAAGFCTCGPYCQCVPGAGCGCLMHLAALAPQQSCPGGVCPVAPAQQPAAVLQPQQLLPGYFLPQQLGDGGCPGGNCNNVQPSRGFFRRR
jgi:hypothetical protein